ncbi:uncharacterized protein LOC124986730 [Sciurus carolinensis]|uniref:uncharacterized protein LOC124986730 n=1 Tax=Sciurus carolinensis TaxID=30640 RepID=UPI001FB42243|nr:uncharacterized protein LOC124986730 [Sciurus carolinensis]
MTGGWGSTEPRSPGNSWRGPEKTTPCGYHQLRTYYVPAIQVLKIRITRFCPRSVPRAPGDGSLPATERGRVHNGRGGGPVTSMKGLRGWELAGNQFDQSSSTHNTGTKEVVAIEEITGTKEKLSTIHRDRCLQGISGISKTPPNQVQGRKGENSFKRPWECPACTGMPRKPSHQDSLHHVQPATQRPPRPWSRGPWLLFELADDLGLNHAELVLQRSRTLEFRSTEASTEIPKGGLGHQASCRGVGVPVEAPESDL